MANIFFARPRHDYHPYRDLYKLIEASGFQLVYFDEMDTESDNLYVMTILNGENQNGWVSPRAQIILWDLEWRLDNPPQIPGVKRVWASDRWYAGRIGAEYVTLGSHRALADGECISMQRDYDLIALMYTDPYRRENAINVMRAKGVRVAPPAWGAERHARLQRSRAMLHLHQHDDIATIAPLRWAIAAAYGLPVISEIVNDPHPFYSTTIWAGYETMKNNMVEVLASDRRLRMHGAMLREQLCDDLDFRTCVERAV